MFVIKADPAAGPVVDVPVGGERVQVVGGGVGHPLVPGFVVGVGGGDGVEVEDVAVGCAEACVVVSAEGRRVVVVSEVVVNGVVPVYNGVGGEDGCVGGVLSPSAVLCGGWCGGEMRLGVERRFF